ncbi:hypothetical protein QL285_007561 [Trifolium repens]|nr:hypothetical protein QL285_007561 [Trifolium repens]
MNPNHRRSRHRKFLIGNVPSPPLFSILAPILLPYFTVLPFVSIFELPYEFLQSIFDAILMREKWKTDIKFGSVYVLFCISSSTILGPISNALFLGPHMGRLIYGTCSQLIFEIHAKVLGKCQLGDEVRKDSSTLQALKAKEAQKKAAQADEETGRLLEDRKGDGSREEK